MAGSSIYIAVCAYVAVRATNISIAIPSCAARERMDISKKLNELAGLTNNI